MIKIEEIKQKVEEFISVMTDQTNPLGIGVFNEGAEYDAKVILDLFLEYLEKIGLKERSD